MNRFCIKLTIFLSLAATVYSEQSVKSSDINSILGSNKSHTKSKKHSDLKEFSSVLFEYIDDVLKRDTIDLLPGIALEKKINSTEGAERKSLDTSFISRLKQFTNNHVLTVNLARASTETGRFFFFKGMNSHEFPHHKSPLFLFDYIG